MNTPQKREVGDRKSEIRIQATKRRVEFSRDLGQWPKILPRWNAKLAALAKLTSVLCLLTSLFSGCQTLSHPNTGPEVADKFWNSYPYFQPVYPQPVYYGLTSDFCPPTSGITRNDFIIATEGGFSR